ncbi:hypothetical protein BH18THE2_BH18THE2_20680 [soil metagenome]
MPNITTRLGQYCTIHGFEHQQEYLVCDYCNEHKSFISLKDRNYNYGFSRRSYLACNECHNTLFGPFRLVHGGIMERAYESIIDVINDKTEKKGYETIDFYEAARFAYTESEYMRKHFDSPKGINNLKKDNKALWEFTYRILYEEKKRVKVVNKNPDNLLVQWISGGMTLTEILKANSVRPVRVWEY